MSNNCKYCGSNIAPHKKYCDKQCYGNDISKKESSVCNFCGDEFEDVPSKNRKYCSRECFGKDKQNRKDVSCEECGSKIWRQINQIKRSNNFYCSNECKTKYEKLREIECKYCEEKFKPETSERKYCSRQCSAKDRKEIVTVNCSECDDSLETTPSYKDKHSNIFCSSDCRSTWLSKNSLFSINNPNKKDGRYGGFGSNWIEWRTKIRNRAEGNCENCGKTNKDNGRKLSVHHIEPRSQFINNPNRSVEDSNNWSNLIALCRSCHMKAEHGSINITNNV